jgi:hypothetical protein
VVPFEVFADAPPAIVESLRRDMAATLDLDPCITARTDHEDPELAANYTLTGSAYAEAGRAFVALQLLDSATSERLWFENYDYRGITAEMMAKDILRYLRTMAPATVRSRLTTGCSGP